MKAFTELESDISILEVLLLKEENEIIVIESQLDTRELSTDGSDDYFQWRINAITAMNKKRTRKNSIKMQLKHWRHIRSQTKTESQIQLKRDALVSLGKKQERNKHDKELRRNAHILMMQARVDKEKEKTRRHQASENTEVLIAMEFKRVVKAFVGMSKYIELIRLADSNVNLK